MGAGLSERAIRSSLTGAWGRALLVFDEIGSTNTEALEWAHAGAPEGAVVVADHQVEGRGRRGRTWTSAPGTALQFSVILRPGSFHRTGLLPTVAGLACAEGIEACCGIDAAIKWPNDVTVEGRKLAGILVETHLEGTKVRACVAGIGVNCHWAEGDVPPALAGHASSIDIERRRRGLAAAWRRDDLLAAILGVFEAHYELLGEAGGPARIVDRAAARSDILGHEVQVHLAGGRDVGGRAVSLAPSGGLVVGTPEGEVILEIGEVERLRAR
jgi:BirA family transcriptional regulator, biotin operon repressor / biotin---[acetyl-CoA-carboxylase] ligase